MSFELLKSQKGREQLAAKGYVYLKEKDTGSKIVWRCSEYRKQKCKGRVHTSGDVIIWETNNHNHAPNSAKIQVKKLMLKIKERALCSADSPHQIVSNEMISSSPSVSALLPPSESIKRSIRRTRQIANPLPTSLSNLELPPELTVTNNGDNFLMFDSGPNDDRILMFVTEENLNLMNTCSHWYVDGTFDAVPPLFAQVYTFHCISSFSVTPTMFVLLPNKSFATYSKMLQYLKAMMPTLCPSFILTDYDDVANSALSEAFPSAILHYSFFHMTLIFWKFISSCPELKLKYEDSENIEFPLYIRQLLALAYVPTSNVIVCFEMLLESPFYKEHEKILQPLLDYFEDTWIGRMTRYGQRRAAKFTIENWNCYDVSLDDMCKTNCSIDHWHKSFASMLASNNSSIFKVIELLKREEKNREKKVEKFVSQVLKANGRSAYKDTSVKLKSVIAEYGKIGLIDYLRDIALYFQLPAM